MCSHAAEGFVSQYWVLVPLWMYCRIRSFAQTKIRKIHISGYKEHCALAAHLWILRIRIKRGEVLLELAALPRVLQSWTAMATQSRRPEKGLKGKATATGEERDRDYVLKECRGLNHKNSPQFSADFQLLWDPDPGGGLPKSSEPWSGPKGLFTTADTKVWD